MELNSESQPDTWGEIAPKMNFGDYHFGTIKFFNHRDSLLLFKLLKNVAGFANPATCLFGWLLFKSADDELRQPPFSHAKAMS